MLDHAQGDTDYSDHAILLRLRTLYWLCWKMKSFSPQN